MPRKPLRPDSLLYVLGQRIAERRLAVGLTQYELGQVIEASKKTIHQYETGQRQPSLDVLGRIANAVDTPLSVLISVLDDHAAPERRGKRS